MAVFESLKHKDDPSCHVCGALMTVSEYTCFSCGATTMATIAASPIPVHIQEAYNKAFRSSLVKDYENYLRLCSEQYLSEFLKRGDSMPSILQVMYTCKTCNVVDEKLTVPHRKDGEDIKDWVNEVGRRIYHDHWSKHPGCNTRLDLKIPIETDKGIGMVP